MHADQMRLRQALLNLMSNANKRKQPDSPKTNADLPAQWASGDGERCGRIRRFVRWKSKKNSEENS
jgi:hypothetical protein